MKKEIITLLSCLFAVFAFSQTNPAKKLVLDKTQPVMELEASCGTCMFKMNGKTCILAVKVDGKSYFVEGTGIDDHGDAHDSTGFCNSIRKAKVQGKVSGEKFVVTYFELIKLPHSMPAIKEHP